MLREINPSDPYFKFEKACDKKFDDALSKFKDLEQ
jgi:hypothetical protein